MRKKRTHSDLKFIRNRVLCGLKKNIAPLGENPPSLYYFGIFVSSTQRAHKYRPTPQGHQQVRIGHLPGQGGPAPRVRLPAGLPGRGGASPPPPRDPPGFFRSEMPLSLEPIAHVQKHYVSMMATSYHTRKADIIEKLDIRCGIHLSPGDIHFFTRHDPDWQGEGPCRSGVTLLAFQTPEEASRAW